MFHFYTPWNHHKNSGFLSFSGGMEMEHLREIDLIPLEALLFAFPYVLYWPLVHWRKFSKYARGISKWYIFAFFWNPTLSLVQQHETWHIDSVGWKHQNKIKIQIWDNPDKMMKWHSLKSL